MALNSGVATFALPGPGGRLPTILAAVWLGLPLVAATAPAPAAATTLSSGGWQFTGGDQAQDVRAVLKLGELNATIAFERDGRQWSIALQSPNGRTPSGAINLTAVYDADASRDRPHRVEKLSLHPQPGAGGAQPDDTLKLALPHTFILHLQAADRIEIEGDGRTVTIPMRGSAKAIAMIYAALGEARGGAGKTMTELANKRDSASSDSASSQESAGNSGKTTVETKVEPAAATVQPQVISSAPRWPGFRCELNDPVEDFGACLKDRMAEIDDFMANTGERPVSPDLSLSEAIKRSDGNEITHQVSRYIEQDYPLDPSLVCNDIYALNELKGDKKIAVELVSDELKCLNMYRIGYLEDLREKYQYVSEYIPVEYYGKQIEEKLGEVIDRAEEKHREFVDALKPRYLEHFEARKAVGLM